MNNNSNKDVEKSICLSNYCEYNQNYPCSCFSNNINIYSSWFDVNYAGERFLPIPITPNAGTWPLAFFKRNEDGKYINDLGKIVNIDIKNPYKSLNFEEQSDFLYSVQCNISKENINKVIYWGNIDPTSVIQPIADILIQTYQVDATNAARILYILNGALNDTFVITWDYKYKYNILRPCQYNQCFRTVICTPKHPSYPSGHSSAAGCMAEILSYFFPQERNKLFQLGAEIGDSRYYAGVHWRMDCEEGFKLGVNIAKSILEYISSQSKCCTYVCNKIYNDNKDAKIMPDYKTLIDDRVFDCDSLLLNLRRFW